MISEESSDGKKCASMCLLLPGKILDLKVLSLRRVFRNYGNKTGAVSGFELLSEHHLGKVITTKINCGANKVFHMNSGALEECCSSLVVFT